MTSNHMFRYGAELDPNQTGFEESIRGAGTGFKKSASGCNS
jgi:hypothetical protein